jgi:hypothetical protein
MPRQPRLMRVIRPPGSRHPPPLLAVAVGWLWAAPFPRDPAPCCDRVRLTMSQWDGDTRIRRQPPLRTGSMHQSCTAGVF